MPQSWRPTSESGRPTHALRLLHAIIREPDSLETGLRLLGMENAREGEACLAWGLDQGGRRVVLYVTSRGVRGHEVCTAVAPVTRLRGHGAGRILVIAAAFDDDLLQGSPDLLGEWGIELCLWSESPEPVLAKSASPDESREDAEAERSEEEPWEPETPGPPPALSPAEVESLVGS